MIKKTLILAIALAIGTLSLPAQKRKSTYTSAAELEKYLHTYSSVLREVDMWYVDSLDFKKMILAGVNATLAQTDRYTVYYSEDEQDDLRRFMTGRYGGIGAVVQQRDSMVQVSLPYTGMPAQKNDVRAGDYILSVNGKDCHGLTTREVSDLLRGKAGTMLELELMREGKTIRRSFLREEIAMPFVRHVAMLNDSVGYIAFDEFAEHAAQEFKRAAENLSREGMKYLLIDLRGNGGGLLSECLEIYSLFMPRGTEMTTTRGKVPSTIRTYKTSTAPLYADLPVYVLVDDESASASEILCGALQDMHRATLIGTKTFGKGVVQNIHNLDNNDQVKITVSRYYLPSGRCIHGEGVTPDIIVEEDSSRLLNISYDLYNRHFAFDYATRYRLQHDSIAALDTRIPCTKPLLDSTDLVQFEAYLGEVNYSYQTETGNYIDKLIEMAKHEDLDPAAMEQLQALREQLGGAYHDALWKNRKEVLQIMEAEVAERYYFEKGSFIVPLRSDPVVLKALEVIGGK